jgi:hypothetical protein
MLANIGCFALKCKQELLPLLIKVELDDNLHNNFSWPNYKPPPTTTHQIFDGFPSSYASSSYN